MFVKQSYELNEKEFIKLAGITEIRYDHEYLSRMPTVLKASVRAFMNGNEEVTRKQVNTNVLNSLRKLGLIEEEPKPSKAWRVSIEATHGFSSYDSDGYAHSIYGVDVSVYRESYQSLARLLEEKG